MTTQYTSAKYTPAPQFRAWAQKSGTPWEVVFRKTATTPHQRRFFATEEAAKGAVSDWLKGRQEAAPVGRRKLDALLQAEALLPDGVALMDAVRFYVANHSGAKDTSLKTVIDECLNDVERRSPTYRKEAKRWFPKLQDFLGADSMVSSIPSMRWKQFVKVDDDSYWNRYARRRCASVTIAKAHEMEALKTNPLEGFTLPATPKKRPFFMTIADAWAVMDYVAHHHEELVPAFALQLFAGIRTEELCRPDDKDKHDTTIRRALGWSDITFEQRIDVGPETAKMGERGVIDFWPKALTSCLAGHTEDKGPICPYSSLKQIKGRIIHALNVERAKAGLEPVKFKQNAFRHSYATYVCAHFQDPGRASLYMRQRDRDVLFTNYRDYTTQAEAVRFFNYNLPTRQPPQRQAA